MAPSAAPTSTKKPVYKRIWFWLAAVLAVIVLASLVGGGGDDVAATPAEETTAEVPVPAPAEEPAEDPEAPAEEPKIAEVGHTFEWEGPFDAGEVTLHSVRREPPPDDYFVVEPENADEWLVADVTVKIHEADAPFTVSTWDFSVQDADGRVYEADPFALDDLPSFDLEVAAGRQARAEVVFDAPKGGELLLDWTPDLGGPLATWRIPA